MSLTHVKSSLYLLLVIFVLSLVFVSSQVSAATDHVVINEIQIAGEGVKDDFVELFNPTDADYDLAGHKLVKRTATGTSDSSLKSFSGETIIPAGGYYLWANSGWTPAVTPDASTSATISANNGIALRNGALDSGEIIDSVAWGTATNIFVEAAAIDTTALESGMSMERVGDDTDNNSVDFIIRENPDPQNAGVSPTPTPTSEPSPSPTASPIPSPTAEPTTEPTVSPSPTQSPSPNPTPPPTSTPKPRSSIMAIFNLLGGKVCVLERKFVRFGFMTFVFPQIRCFRI